MFRLRFCIICRQCWCHWWSDEDTGQWRRNRQSSLKIISPPLSLSHINCPLRLFLQTLQRTLWPLVTVSYSPTHCLYRCWTPRATQPGSPAYFCSGQKKKKTSVQISSQSCSCHFSDKKAIVCSTKRSLWTRRSWHGCLQHDSLEVWCFLLCTQIYNKTYLWIRSKDMTPNSKSLKQRNKINYRTVIVQLGLTV